MNKKKNNKRKAGMVKVDLSKEELDQVSGGFYHAVSGGYNGGAMDPPTLPELPGLPEIPGLPGWPG